ncbi:hypothetical protein [Natrialba aegyptia]|uniref:hypothetical protein n=1 Tax=Natrialba aegyptia TaxID=129789 RepID=UPI000AD60942|nr:hypothetical protein [Natrialba aegyptia]
MSLRTAGLDEKGTDETGGADTNVGRSDEFTFGIGIGVGVDIGINTSTGIRIRIRVRI